MKINTLIASSVMIFSLTGFFQLFSIPLYSRLSNIDDYIEQIGNNATMNWTTYVLQVKGSGFGPESVKHLERRKLLAKRAAELDALRKLSESIKGVRVTAHTRVEDLMLRSDTVKTRTESMIKGMRLLEVNYSKTGCCEVTVAVDIHRDGTFLLNSLNDGEISMTDNYPKFDWEAALRDMEEKNKQLTRIKSQFKILSDDFKKKQEELSAAKRELEIREETEKRYKPSGGPGTGEPFGGGNGYTGLLVDARGFDLRPVLYPSIITENEQKMFGRGVFSTGPFSPVPYAPGDVNTALEKYNNKRGKNPLVVKCIKPVGEQRSDIMISNEDAQKMISIRDLLEKDRVAILR
jgi:hypothetical protein